MAAGVCGRRGRCSRDGIERRFAAFEVVAVDLRTGDGGPGFDVSGYDPAARAADPDASRPARANDAQVVACRITRSSTSSATPRAGSSCSSCRSRATACGRRCTATWRWAPDLTTVRGLTFYQHGETPGLGGEVDNPRWKRSGPAASRSTAGRDRSSRWSRARRPASPTIRTTSTDCRARRSPAAASRACCGSGSATTASGRTWTRAADGQDSDGRAARRASSTRCSTTTRSRCRCSASARRWRSPRSWRRRSSWRSPSSFVIALSNLFVSLLRNQIPSSIRIIVQLTIIASLVIVVDQILKAFLFDDLEAAVGVRRTDHHQLHRDGPRRGLRDAEPAGPEPARRHRQRPGLRPDPAAWSARSASCSAPARSSAVRSWRWPTDGGWYTPNGLMVLAPGAFFLIGLIIWALRTWKPAQVEKAEAKSWSTT